jgi:TPR repeat protein
VLHDDAQAALWFRKAAEQGFAEAQLQLGHLYLDGHGVPQDYVLAALWYRKAAEQDDTAAQSSLAELYESGHGVPRDYAQALAWRLKAAERGDAWVLHSLGLFYYRGQGVPQDYAEAYFWYDLAAASATDDFHAERLAKDRDEAASHLTPADLSREQERARKWFEEHQAKPQ